MHTKISKFTENISLLILKNLFRMHANSFGQTFKLINIGGINVFEK